MSVGPYPKLFQQILACAPFLSVPQSQQETTPNQQDLPLIPIPPAISQDLTPEKTRSPGVKTPPHHGSRHGVDQAFVGQHGSHWCGSLRPSHTFPAGAGATRVRKKPEPQA